MIKIKKKHSLNLTKKLMKPKVKYKLRKDKSNTKKYNRYYKSCVL